ncbi:uncharacterized protein LOC128223932 [Mya arenaria]|uniref:uncharacterized protein LOC128223932 n=1 Tax=Mya arenaria TaxID=6604 RepID=UPI0022E26800|nr:uncharacterized protein LOC128223932 [Mya arenaria]XP_052789382.1 uncharacterized protein LOC128223932 [Mya arenaria]
MMSACPKPTRKETGCGIFNCVAKTVAVTPKPKHLAVICITANIILTLAFLLLIIVWAVVRMPLTLSKESSACILCDRTKSNAYTNPDQEASGHSVIKRRDDGMCCGPVESIAQMLFQKEMAEYYYSSSSQSLIDIAEEYADCERKTNDKQPIAKVVGIVEFKPCYIVEGHYRVIWNKNGRTFYSNNCVHLELEGEIFVRQAGYYIVSSQLNLRRQMETSTPNNETRPTTFIHQVNLLSHMYGTTGVLMQTMKSVERHTGYFFTSLLSAVFKLNKNDRLSVSVSHPELLDIDNPNDLFLAYYTYDLPN